MPAKCQLSEGRKKGTIELWSYVFYVHHNLSQPLLVRGLFNY